ncbi:hypothetical protein ASZ90_007514 [hydrocarbon metagenome]|uniref:Uncharacterized protein n=1 Tax=hydrocarbon metagenome TaxID=938273 RepID=A0A0W8FP59_9ZZZZ
MKGEVPHLSFRRGLGGNPGILKISTFKIDLDFPYGTSCLG